MSDEKIDFLCDDCGEAFSAFLHDMADHNAKVTACPKGGRNHEFRPPETPSQLRGTQSIEKTRIHPTNRKSAGYAHVSDGRDMLRVAGQVMLFRVDVRFAS